ncbi:MAG: hypothetical protein ABI369_04120 [Acetobacteraceae bacterium]
MTRERAERTAWILGGLGVLGCVIGWIVTPLFPHAWLAAFIFWMGWPLGSMALLLIHSTTGGRWGYAIRPQLVMGVATLPLVLLVILPLLFVLKPLYPWARPDVAAELGNTAYLNVPFVCGRAVLYLLIWLGLAALILRALRRDEPDPSLYRLAPAGLILLMLTVTYGGFDSSLSLDPHFNSSIYGMILAGEGVLFALAVATLLTLLIAPPMPSVTQDLGRLMLALVLLWGYFEFMQLLIVWNSDLAADAPWYVARVAHGWGIVAGIIFVVHFLVPFLLLIWPQVQRSHRAMLVISAMIIAAEVLRRWWLVVPAAEHALSWVDVCAMFALGGFGAGLGLRAVRLPMLARAVRQHG